MRREIIRKPAHDKRRAWEDARGDQKRAAYRQKGREVSGWDVSEKGRVLRIDSRVERASL